MKGWAEAIHLLESIPHIAEAPFGVRGCYGIRQSRCRCFFFFQAEDGIRVLTVTGVQTCALPISGSPLVGTALPFVVSQPLQPADLARFSMHIGHVNRRLNIRANEHGVLSVGGHIDDRLPVRSARETYRSAPWPSGPSIDFERPHVGLALIRRLLRP